MASLVAASAPIRSLAAMTSHSPAPLTVSRAASLSKGVPLSATTGVALSQVTAGVACQAVMRSVVVAVSPTVTARVSSLLVEAVALLGTAPLAEAALGAARTLPVVVLLEIGLESPAASVTAAAGAWEAFLRRWVADALV